MAGWGYALAGLAQGLGAGLVKQAELSAIERRELALANMRAEQAQALRQQQHEDKLTEISAQGNINDRNNARQAERDMSKSIAVGNAASKNRQTERAQDFEFDRRLEFVKSGLTKERDAASERLKADIDAGKVDSVIPGEDGNYRVVYRGGRIVDTGIKAPPKELVGGRSAGGDDNPFAPGGSALGRSRSGGTIQPGKGPVAAPKPAAPKVGEVVDGWRYSGGDPRLESSWTKLR